MSQIPQSDFKSHPKLRKWVQHGYNMAKLRPQWPRQGSEIDFGAKKGVRVTKHLSICRPKWIQHHTKKPLNIDCVLRAVRVVTFSFFVKKRANIDPSGHPIRLQKRFLAENARFRSHTVKQMSFEGKLGFGSPIFDTQCVQQLVEKRISIAISLRDCVFPFSHRFLDGFGSQNSTPTANF